MPESSPKPAGLIRGQRIPNFARATPDGRTLIFYEFANGRPLLLAACGLRWSEARCRRFVNVVHAAARERDAQSVVVTGRGFEAVPPNADAVTVVDEDGALLARLLHGAQAPEDEAMIHVGDPNLRILESVGVEPAALEGDALYRGLNRLLEDSLEELRAEQSQLPAVAPVLIVPRVLGPELCRGLIDSFPSWRPKASPMPTEDGGLEVDGGRKSRLDVVLGDDDLERELQRMIAQRVLPEVYKAFHYRATRFERLKIVCYPSEASGHFGAHRDNTAPTTAHRRFALTLNLNAGDYDGGELEFPEYGAGCAYNVPTGAAVLFSGTHAHRVRPVTRGDRYALISFCFGEAEAEERLKGPRPS